MNILQEQINNELKAAMISKKTPAINALRGLKSAISSAALNTGNINTKMSDLDILAVVRKQVKQRYDSVAAFRAADRKDLISKEEAEIVVLESFLPKSLSDCEVDEIIQSAISETGATSKRQMGAVIKRAVELAAGRIDNKTISTKVGAILV